MCKYTLTFSFLDTLKPLHYTNVCHLFVATTFLSQRAVDTFGMILLV